jgi:hypothetical protein
VEPTAQLPESVQQPVAQNQVMPSSPVIVPTVTAPQLPPTPPQPAPQTLSQQPQIGTITQQVQQTPQQPPTGLSPSMTQTTQMIGLPTMVMGNGFSPDPSFFQRKKKLFVFAGIGVATVLLAVGGVFAFYIPTTPNSVWSTGISRSGKALDIFVNSSLKKDTLTSIAKSEITATVDADVSGVSYTGSLDTKYDASKSDTGLDFTLKAKDQSEKKISLKALTDIPTGKQLPDIYFQLTGLKALGLDSLLPGITEYEGKWISIDSSYIEKSLSGTTVTNSGDQLTADDVTALLKIATSVSKDYLFTTNDSKNVLVKKEFVGKEKEDGLNVYHYLVGLNKSHADAYCTELINKIVDSPVYLKLPGVTKDTLEKDKDSFTSSCKNIYKDAKDTDELDLWIDGSSKLIYKVRLYDKSNAKIYADIGQKYKGDTLTVFVNEHDETSNSDLKFSLNFNLKTATTEGELTAKSTQKDNDYSVKVTFGAKPFSGDINAQKPAGSISLETVLNKLGFGGIGNTPITPTPSPSPISKSSADVERRTDVNALFTQLEVFYNDMGYYPNLTDLNSSTWRAANIKGLDAAAYKDPSGTSSLLAATASKTQYGYSATDCAPANECQHFSMSAIFSDGSVYKKDSLN